MTHDNPLRDDRDGRVVHVGEHRVELAYDPDGEVWYVRSSTVPGLTGESGSLSDLADTLPALVRAASLP